MADYTKLTDFEAKDSLPSGDTNKVVRGSEFEVEFDNIATAIATKADKASPTFTGTATIPTAAITTLNLGGVAVTSTAAELNKLDGVTATTAEINYLGGVTSNIQTQIDGLGTGDGTVTSVAMTVPTGLSVAGTPITTSGTLAVTYTAGYAIPTTAKQTQWDTAYSWGNHASAGYLTSLGTAILDGDFTVNGLMSRTGAGTYTSVTDNSSNWNTAFGWGNHASAGYAPTASPTFTGTVTAPIVDINAGAIDGTTIGGASAAAGTFTTATATSVVLGLWTISVIANELVFDYNGTDVFKLKTTGEVVSANDITAFGTV
jgi:hypothetical protein